MRAGGNVETKREVKDEIEDDEGGDSQGEFLEFFCSVFV